jgi:hypothetical protein
MRAEVMEFYGLTRSPRAVGYYETAYHRPGPTPEIRRLNLDGLSG